MIVIIFGVIIIGILIYFSLKYNNPFKLIFVFGKKGSGKSTYLVKQMIRYHKKGYAVYTNMTETVLPYVRIIKTGDIGDFIPEPKSLLVIDEVGMVWDSRKFKEFKDSTRDFFKLQRHYKVVCLLASQTYDVDKKLRDLADSMILVNNVFNALSLNRPIIKKIVLTESQGDAESRISENLQFKSIFNWKITYIPRYIKYFDSYDVPEKEYLIYRNPEKALTEIDKPVKEKKNKMLWLKELKNEFIRVWKTDIDFRLDTIYILIIGTVVIIGIMAIYWFFVGMK